MATPPVRTPVRLARGSKANLTTALSAGDLKEGELCYAKDEDALLMVEGGLFVTAGSGGGGGSGGGRGDGGDFNTGTVDLTYVLGVYGGGDFNTGNDDTPIELSDPDLGPDAGAF